MGEMEGKVHRYLYSCTFSIMLSAMNSASTKAATVSKPGANKRVFSTVTTVTSNGTAEKATKAKVATGSVAKRVKLSSVSTTGGGVKPTKTNTTSKSVPLCNEVEDDDDDLGISLSSIESTPPPSDSKTDEREIEKAPLTPIVMQKQIATPTSTKLRERLTKEDSQMEDKENHTVRLPTSTSNFISNTPRASKLREELRLTPPTSQTTTVEKTSTLQTHTPHAERLREALLMRTTPPSSTLHKTATTPSVARSTLKPTPATKTMTPRAESLAALRMEITPPEEKGSMAAIQRDSEQIASRTPAMTASKPVVDESIPSPVITPEQAVQPEVLTPPQPTMLLFADNISHENTPVARNLMSEIDDLNASASGAAQLNTSAIVCPALEEEDQQEEKKENVDMTQDCSEESDQPTDLPSSLLFEEDEFIPGLSTPAIKNLGSAQKTIAPSLFAEEEAASPIQFAAASSSSSTSTSSSSLLAVGTPSKLLHSASKSHTRLLTPSKSQLSAAASSSTTPNGGSAVVLASVKAHPRDALKLGSDTFLSPVRRSLRARQRQEDRDNSKKNDVEMDQVDQKALEGLLKDNNYAYHPNPALSSQLTPIPKQRAHRVADPNVSGPAPSVVSTPMPTRSMSALSSGSSLIVLQTVRSRRRSSSTAATSSSLSSNPDPRSAEYLLSPVRRSARHTAPQSMAELTKILTHTKYAYQANPLIQEEEIFGTVAPATVPATPPTSSSSSSSSYSSSSESSVRESKKVQKSLAAIAEEVNEEEDEDADTVRLDDVDPRSRMDLMDEVEFTSPSLLNRVTARAASVPVRKTTPMPMSKKASRHTMQPVVAIKEDAAMEQEESRWEKSYSSSSYSSKEDMMKLSAVASSSSSSSVSSSRPVHKLDEDGFKVPLLPSQLACTNSKRGVKRRSSAAALDEIEAKLSLVAVSMMEAKGMLPSSSSSSSTSSRMSTPRPGSKRSKRGLEEFSLANEAFSAIQPFRHDTPVAIRRSSRVATPIR